MNRNKIDFAFFAILHLILMLVISLFVISAFLIRTECPDGRYGRNCKKKCSKHCIISERCDSVIGQCVGGCQSGWKNNQCDKGKI